MEQLQVLEEGTQNQEMQVAFPIPASGSSRSSQHFFFFLLLLTELLFLFSVTLNEGKGGEAGLQSNFQCASLSVCSLQIIVFS